MRDASEGAWLCCVQGPDTDFRLGILCKCAEIGVERNLNSDIKTQNRITTLEAGVEQR